MEKEINHAIRNDVTSSDSPSHRRDAGSDPFNWIKLHPLMDAQTQKDYTFDHAGIGETSLMMSLCPEGVDMKKFTEDKWYARSAKDATKEYGDTAKVRILEHLRKILKD